MFIENIKISISNISKKNNAVGDIWVLSHRKANLKVSVITRVANRPDISEQSPFSDPWAK